MNMNFEPLESQYVSPVADVLCSGMEHAVLENTDINWGANLDDMGETDYEWEL